MPDESEITRIIAHDFGANATYVEDLLRQYQHNPGSVGDEWETYFSDLLRANGAVKPETKAAPESPATATTVDGAAAGERVPIRGPALKIVENMESSLGVPVATSARQIQIKLLDENRGWVNRYLTMQGKGKISYTHFIAWAMLKALAKNPWMNDGFEMIDNQAHRIRRPLVNLGIAVDLQKKDGSRSLLVPNIKGANQLTFSRFVAAYQDVVSRARNAKLQVGDFQGTTITLTNPGTIGTVASSPRLMAGQGAIIATGAIEYPPEYAAMTEEAPKMIDFRNRRRPVFAVLRSITDMEVGTPNQ